MLTQEQIDDIVILYRDAKDKPGQIQILSQLNSVPTAQIRKILFEAGHYPIGAPEIAKIKKKLQSGKYNPGSVQCCYDWLRGYKGRYITSLLDDWATDPWDEVPAELFTELCSPVEAESNKKIRDLSDEATVMLRGLLFDARTEIEDRLDRLQADIDAIKVKKDQLKMELEHLKELEGLV